MSRPMGNNRPCSVLPSLALPYLKLGLHMGPNNLCYVTRHFFFPMTLCHFLYDLDVTFYSFYKRLRRISTTVKVAVSHFVFYPCGALKLGQGSRRTTSSPRAASLIQPTSSERHAAEYICLQKKLHTRRPPCGETHELRLTTLEAQFKLWC